MSSVTQPVRPQTDFTKRTEKVWVRRAERRRFVSFERLPMEHRNHFQKNAKKDLTNLS